MQVDEIKITTGENAYQKAYFEQNDKMIDYETSKNLSYSGILTIYRGLNVISEFYDVPSAVSITPFGICAVALGKTTEDAVTKVLDSDPIDFISSVIVLSKELDSETAKLLKDTRIVVAPSFTKNAEKYLEEHDICCVNIKTPLKEYKKYLSNRIIETPLGTITQQPNYSELDKDVFKAVTKIKPTTEQIEDAVFAWKVAKHANSRTLVIAKDLKTAAIAQGMQSSSIEFVLDYSCDGSKEAVLASDTEISLHDLNVAAQGRVSVVILPSVSKDIVEVADKYQMIIITTGYTNILAPV